MQLYQQFSKIGKHVSSIFRKDNQIKKIRENYFIEKSAFYTITEENNFPFLRYPEFSRRENTCRI